MKTAEPYVRYNMWNDKKCSHDTRIGMAPTYCEACGMSGAELSERWCPKADPARLAATLDLKDQHAKIT